MIGLLAVYAFLAVDLVACIAYAAHREQRSPFTWDFWNGEVVPETCENDTVRRLTCERDELMHTAPDPLDFESWVDYYNALITFQERLLELELELAR